jgi:hypothetical protein
MKAAWTPPALTTGTIRRVSQVQILLLPALFTSKGPAEELFITISSQRLKSATTHFHHIPDMGFLSFGDRIA